MTNNNQSPSTPPQILNVAARHGDGQLAMDMFYAMEGWGYAPSASAFNAVLQALALSRNDVAMLKALNVRCVVVGMHGKGWRPKETVGPARVPLTLTTDPLPPTYSEISPPPPPYPYPPCHPMLIPPHQQEMCAWGLEPSEGTLHLIAKQFSSSVSRLDDAYNNLVALRRAHEASLEQQQQLLQQQEEEEGQARGNGSGTQPAPAAAAATPAAASALPVAAPAVYLIVLGCAYANQLDRAFATFEDYGPVFGLRHDAPACNALLLACLRARSLQVGAAFSVMTEMERLSVAPDQETCHLMVRILVQAKEPDTEKVRVVMWVGCGGGVSGLGAGAGRGGMGVGVRGRTYITCALLHCTAFDDAHDSPPPPPQTNQPNKHTNKTDGAGADVHGAAGRAAAGRHAAAAGALARLDGGPRPRGRDPERAAGPGRIHPVLLPPAPRADPRQPGPAVKSAGRAAKVGVGWGWVGGVGWRILDWRCKEMGEGMKRNNAPPRAAAGGGIWGVRVGMKGHDTTWKSK
jgi:hypothetical protein